MLILCIFLGIACYFDYRKGRIPNLLILGALTAGIVRALWRAGPPGAGRFLISGFFVILVFYPLFRIGTLGAGDIKLFGVCCGFLPKESILYFLFFTLLFAAMFSILHFVKKADFKERFVYLFSYLKEVACSGEWKLYWGDSRERKQAGICMAGPVLLSILLYMGGVY